MCIFMSKNCFQLNLCSYRCIFKILLVTTDQSERWFCFSDPVRRFNLCTLGLNNDYIILHDLTVPF